MTAPNQKMRTQSFDIRELQRTTNRLEQQFKTIEWTLENAESFLAWSTSLQKRAKVIVDDLALVYPFDT